MHLPNNTEPTAGLIFSEHMKLIGFGSLRLIKQGSFKTLIQS